METWVKILVAAVLFGSTRLMDRENMVLVSILRVYALIVYMGLISTWFFIWRTIVRRNDRRTLEISTATNNFLVTVAKYDKDSLKSMVFKRAILMVITGFIHFRFGSLPPILVAPTMNMLILVSDPLFKIHVLKKSENLPGLARPFNQKVKNE